MYKLSICDDDANVLQEASALLRAQYNALFEIRCYQQAQALCADLALAQFVPDIILMDIEYGAVNGVALAEEINQKHTAIQFIFITSYNERYSQAIFLHQVNLVGYVAKPMAPAILFANFDKVLERAQKEAQNVLLINNRDGTRAVPQNEIVFIESIGHSLLVCMQQETITYTGKLDEAEKQLYRTFVRVHKSFLVNLHFIESIRGKEALLVNHQTAPISRNYFEKVRMAYYTYWGRCL
ncbi:MAG: LytTR family DNA-binding domain-containing protein [Ruthenibacterium sp.]